MNAREMREELAQGWSSPETYAAHLHLTADEGLVWTALKALHIVEVVEGAVTPDLAGQTLAGLLERHLDQLDDAGLVDEYREIRNDVGSFWRVNWTEVGAAFLDDERIAA